MGAEVADIDEDVETQPCDVDNQTCLSSAEENQVARHVQRYMTHSFLATLQERRQDSIRIRNEAFCRWRICKELRACGHIPRGQLKLQSRFAAHCWTLAAFSTG